MNGTTGWDADEAGSIIDSVTALKGRVIADAVGYNDERFRTSLDERTALVTAFAEKYGEADLPTVCLGLRMSCNGAADPWGNEFLTAVVEYLKERMRLWLLPIDAIDYCVYVMCGEAVRLGEAELSYRDSRGWKFTGLDGEGWK